MGTTTRRRRPDPRKAYATEWWDIGPEKAQELLAKNAVNRRVRPRLVASYAEDMREGLWNDTGDPIRISRTGRLLDGQHRCAAIIESGATLQLLVITGLPDESQSLMDQGAARSAKDALQMAGRTNAAHTAGVARWVLLAGVPGPELEQRLKFKASTARIVKIVEEQPDIEVAAGAYTGLRNHIPGSPTAVAYSWLFMHRADPEDCQLFYAAMVDMTFKALEDPRKAALRALHNLERDEGIGAASKDRALATVSILTRAWNAWRKGEDRASLPIRARGRIIAPEEPI